MILSILIATSPENKVILDQLLATLLPQIKGLDDQLEIFIEGVNYHNKLHIGEKMNSLIRGAEGDYVWFLKDTDLLSDTAIDDLMSALLMEPDVVTISGMTTFNDRTPCDWKQGIDCERKPKYNSPMKRELALKVPFRKRRIDAIEEWERQIQKLHPWKSFTDVEKPIMHERRYDDIYRHAVIKRVTEILAQKAKDKE